MRAICWHGPRDVRLDRVPDPTILDPGDAIVRVTATAICGSDLHVFDGFMPTMKTGDVLGHEAMGEVVEVGKAVTRLRRGDRVVVPFVIACGSCFFCKRGEQSGCDVSNPNARMAREIMGHSPAGLFGYSHMMGGFWGGQAEYLRVPFADVGPLKIESELTDEQVLFLSDIFPTGYFAADLCGIEPGDTVAVWGCGPVGQMTIRSAWMLGAGRVVAIDRVPERLRMAEAGRTEIVNFEETPVYDQLMDLTRGRGPDRCVDAVGCEAHGLGSADAVMDKVKTAVMGTDRAHVLREAIMCCRKFGTVSIPGVYVGAVDKLPMGPAMNKGLTFRMGQTPVQRYQQLLLAKIEAGEIDPSFVITHRLPLEQGPAAYRTFRDKQDGCIKVVLRP
ncbi:glutathione-dependent formaldehyde dehydrogenase [Nannocystis sp. ILAH1]|uniref:zinc-dependent alcohol dehydrogenase n=1 Tax=unclassified Nannocystis TaxID=2627009 RepID=UPI002271D4C5|nr:MULTISPECIES: zinc-dependent alcohol dehydrogenase [unclassified Nannocystis]MCY0989405.1 glutathione-dependent formaldehyde dehydrogenase [Nannocystis sp. ILAH1]MCY1064900.1 glutathione-dependent formaldehyde dehydrogenase [Nannocystis sp. RBIL2]